MSTEQFAALMAELRGMKTAMHWAAVEKNDLDKLVARCRGLLEERPNHAYARWYLARSLLLQEQWAVALEQLTILRPKFPDWGANVDPLIKEARSRLESGHGDAVV